jgi:hypothetical protein
MDKARVSYDRALVLAPGGIVCILDMMTDASRTRPKYSVLFSVNMALTTENGWAFSDEDLGGWLAEAAFRDSSVRPLAPPMPHWLTSAVKQGPTSGRCQASRSLHHRPEERLEGLAVDLLFQSQDLGPAGPGDLERDAFHGSEGCGRLVDPQRLLFRACARSEDHF